MAGEPFCLYLLGRLRGVTRGRLTAAAAAAGGRLARQPNARVTLVALGQGSARACLGGGRAVRLPPALRSGVEIVSELALKRRLGLAPPGPEARRAHSADELARASGLDLDSIRALGLYDVIEGEGGLFGFRDLRAAREVRRLLDRGLSLAEIVEAALALRRHGRGLFDTSLADTPWGEIVQGPGGRLARLDGQYLLPLDEAFRSADDLFGEAEECELAGDLAGAERLYRQAAGLDRTDPVIPFNLGNVLDAMGRPREAAVAYRRSLERDPAFAEAWVNLAGLHERAGHVQKAVECLERAVQAQPDYADAVYALASLAMRQERYREALPLWDRYIALRPPAREAEKALRCRRLCGLAAAELASRTGADGSGTPARS